jgi:hypothetical protein
VGRVRGIESSEIDCAGAAGVNPQYGRRKGENHARFDQHQAYCRLDRGFRSSKADPGDQNRLQNDSGREDRQARNLDVRPLEKITEKQGEQKRYGDRAQYEIDNHHKASDQSGCRIDSRPKPSGCGPGRRRLATQTGVGQNGRQRDYQGCEEDERRNGSRCRLDRPPRRIEANGRRGNADDKSGKPPRADDPRLQARRYFGFVDMLEFQDCLSSSKSRCAI